MDDPIELYKDLIRLTDPQPEFDLSRPEVRQRLREDAAALPGPETANVWQWGLLCTSFCDFNAEIHADGRRQGSWTCATPEGPKEIEGNAHAEFTCETCSMLEEHGKEFLVESSMPSGRYPKLWDLKCMQQLREKTGALIVPTYMCPWGKQAADAPGKRYRKGSWWLVSLRLYLYALLLARHCRGDHDHMAVKVLRTSRTYPGQEWLRNTHTGCAKSGPGFSWTPPAAGPTMLFGTNQTH